MLFSTAWAKNQEKELFLVAQKAFEDGFYDVAIRYIEQLIQEYPQTEHLVQSKLLLGQCYFFQSQYLKAYDIFNSLLKYAEFKDATLFWLGETFLKGMDYGQAEKNYRQLIALFPESSYAPQAYYSLGWTYFEQEKYADSQQSFAEFVDKYPRHQLAEDAAFKVGESYFHLREYNDAINAFKNYLQYYQQTGRHAEAYFYLAESFYYQDEYQQAVDYYRLSVDKALDKRLIMMNSLSLGWGYLKLMNYEDSERSFRAALELSYEKKIPSDDIYLGLAGLYVEQKRFNEALTAYDKLIQEYPQSSRMIDALLGKANIHYLLEEYDQAITTYKTVIENFIALNSDGNTLSDQMYDDLLEKTYFGLAWAYLKKGDLNQSIIAFETIKDKAKSKVVKISALTQIGDAFQDVDQLERAVGIYDQILKDYTDSPYADYVQYRQGIALLKMGEIEAATLSFQSLQLNFPQSSYLNDVEYYLAVAYFKKGDWLTAKDHIEKFLTDKSYNYEFGAEAYYILALTNFNIPDYQAALKTFQKIVRGYPQERMIIRTSELSIAKCYYKLGKVNEALKKFKILIFKYPETEISQEALIWLGDHYLEAGDYNNAVAYYKQFIEIFPGSPKISIIYYELGQAYIASEAYDKAVNVLKKVSDPKDGDVYVKAKLAIADIFARDFESESAIETYENIIYHSPEFKRDAYVKMAGVYKKISDYDNTLVAYQKALESKRGLSAIKNVQLQFFIAETYEILNQRDLAVKEYFRIPYLYEKKVEWVVRSYLRIAKLFEHQERWDDVKLIYQKIIELKTDESVFAEERIEWLREHNHIK